mgnify:CR=1 FL=1
MSATKSKKKLTGNVGGARAGAGRKAKYPDGSGWVSIHMPRSLIIDVNEAAKQQGVSRSEVVIQAMQAEAPR